MKKITLFTIISFMILGLASVGMAADITSSDGEIDLDGTGTGMEAVMISAKGEAVYTSDAGAGGLGAGGTDGEQYAIVTGSTAGTAGIHLDFMMRGSQANSDNNVYQRLTGQLGVSTATSTDPTSTASVSAGWVVRGGS